MTPVRQERICARFANGADEFTCRTTSRMVQPAFDDSSWLYFRHRFFVDKRTRFGAIYADVLFDDGFVIYLNGHEVGRDFMPLGPVDARTLAWNHEAHGRYVPYDLTSGLPYLQEGENWLAVEVHQASETSRDLAFDLSMLLQVR
jgi:hypothetical protein